MKAGLVVSTFLLSLACATDTWAQTLCVWDPMGTQGEFSSLLADYRLAAVRWGVHLDIKVFIDEPESVNAFNSGKCDLLNMLGARARGYNEFTGSIDSPGGLNNYAQVRQLLLVLSSKAAQSHMISGDYETVGIFPLGALYPVVNDRSINSLEAVKGKRVAVMDWEPMQSDVVRSLGAIPVPVPMTSFARMFSTRQVDAITLPMILYKPLELEKTIGSTGGIIRRPLLQFTMQLISRRGQFPADFGVLSRTYMLDQVDHALAQVHHAEADVLQSQWLYSSKQQLETYDQIVGGIRDHLAKSGYYDKSMLSVMAKIRCTDQASSESSCNSPR